MNALQQRATIEWNRMEHPYAAVKRRLEQSLRLNAAPKAIVPPIAPSQRHSTKQIGECGQRIGEKIDAILWLHAHYEPEADWPDDELFEIDDEPLGLDELLLEIQTEPDTHAESAVQICRAELIQTATDQVAPPVVITASAAPPSPQGAGEQSADASAAVGGCSGFTNELELNGTAWQMVAGTDGDERGPVENLQHLQTLLESNPEIAGPMLMGVLVRLRAALQQIPRDADAMHPVTVPACDAVLLSRSVLKGLR